MNRTELVLAALSQGQGHAHTPVQVQKLLFLIDRNVAEHVGGPHFRFTPYNYGPFDAAVYKELEGLARQGSVEVILEHTWRDYRLTPEGQRAGEDAFARMPLVAQDYVRRASEFVRKLSFSQLVSAIYRAYPEMRARSVFQERQ